MKPVDALPAAEAARGRADGPPVLYSIVCGSPAARGVAELVRGAQQDGWRVCVLASPSALRFIDAPGLAELTGYPVRSRYKNPDEPDLLPAADAIVVAPATCNTINKWAAGVSDTLVLGILTEALGLALPIVAVPWSNVAHVKHPAFQENVRRLRSWGVQVLFGGDVCRLPGPNGTGDPDPFPWHLARAAVRDRRPA